MSLFLIQLLNNEFLHKPINKLIFDEDEIMHFYQHIYFLEVIKNK